MTTYNDFHLPIYFGFQSLTRFIHHLVHYFMVNCEPLAIIPRSALQRLPLNICGARLQFSDSNCQTKPHADNKVKIISGDIIRRNHHGEENIPKPQTIMDISRTIPMQTEGGMQRDCIQMQISRSQIPHTQESQIQTTLH